MAKRWREITWFLTVMCTWGLANQPTEPQKKDPTRIWLERFDGSSLKAMGWEGGNLEDGKIDHRLVTEGGNTFLRSHYLVGTEAKCLRKPIEWDAQIYPWLRWRWRVGIFPKNANVLDSDHSDAAAQVYVLWRHFPIYYVLKYYWGWNETVGAVLDQSSFFFGRLHGEIVRSGGPTGEWHTEIRNIYEDFKNAFHSEPPGNVRGFAVLSDGDETKSDSEADYDDFEILTTPTNPSGPVAKQAFKPGSSVPVRP